MGAGERMEALVWTAPREMVMRSEPVPEPGPDDVLVEVAVAGICAGAVATLKYLLWREDRGG